MTSEFEQTPFAGTETRDPEEPKCACLLLLDVSLSMEGEPIAKLNAGLQRFAAALRQDNLAMKRVEIAVVTFGPVSVMNEFTSARDFFPIELSSQGATPMGEAIVTGLDLLRKRKEYYKNVGIDTYRPWVFLITDGHPTDSIEQAAKLVHSGEEGKSFSYFAVGTEGADFESLSKLSVRPPLQLDGLAFEELFQWLSDSMQSVSASKPDEEAPLPTLTWGSAPN